MGGIYPAMGEGFSTRRKSVLGGRSPIGERSWNPGSRGTNTSEKGTQNIEGRKPLHYTGEKGARCREK